jgi:ABC-type transport system substrate-binding protein
LAGNTGSIWGIASREFSYVTGNRSARKEVGEQTRIRMRSIRVDPSRDRKCGAWLWWSLLWLTLAGCSDNPWNNPYPRTDAEKNILYSSFSERPKHLDPVRSYSANEYTFIGQIYEPPLQYHYLLRPYRLEPLTAAEVPEPVYYDAAGAPLPPNSDLADVEGVEYEVQIKPGIRFQPHPAFARNAAGEYLYHDLQAEQTAGLHSLGDFSDTGSRELTAADYVYQIKRLAFPRLHSPINSLMQGYIVGFKDYGNELAEAYDELKRETGQKKPFLDLRDFPMEGAEVVDRYRYRIRLSTPYPQFVYWLAMPFFSPMPWEADRFYSQPGLDAQNITLDWYPVGTGPFMLAENNPNLRMVLERNPYFDHESYPLQGDPGDAEKGLLQDAGKPLPFLDKAIYNLEKEAIPYWNKFLQGYYDGTGLSSDAFDQAVQFGAQGQIELTDAMKQRGIRLQTSVTTSIYYMGFNMRDPVVGGDSQRARLLRRAISIAVDFEEYLSIFANGRGVAAQGILPPGIFGHREGGGGINTYVYAIVEGKPRRKSIEEAKRILAQAGYPGGVDKVSGQPLILYFDGIATGPDDKPRLNWIRKQLKKLGVQLVLRTTDYNRFQEKMRKGTAQIFWWGWNADYPDPENFLFLLYGGNCKVDGGGENAANYQNPEYDVLFNQMKNMANGPERQKIIDQMMEMLRRDAPWIWGYHPKAFSLYHSWYKNVKPNLMANNTLKYKRIDAQQRMEARDAWNQPVVWPLWVLSLLVLVSILPAVFVYLRRERSGAL